jgi:hypothetical protein
LGNEIPGRLERRVVMAHHAVQQGFGYNGRNGAE